MATAVPQPLEQAIENASNQYGVPQDLLEGIWRVESGSSFPNPYANGLGYGGEFGTKIVSPFGSAQDIRRVAEPPAQQQANTAAQILANLLRSKDGNVAEALSAYSGGGYTQVPGEVTFGNVQTGALAAGLNPGQNTQGSTGLAQPASFVSGIESIPGKILGGTLGGVEKIVIRGLEIAFGVGLVALGVAGIFVALSKSSSGGAVGTLAEIAVAGGVAGKRAASGERKAERQYRERSYIRSREGIAKKDDTRSVETGIGRKPRKRKPATALKAGEGIPF